MGFAISTMYSKDVLPNHIKKNQYSKCEKCGENKYFAKICIDCHKASCADCTLGMYVYGNMVVLGECKECDGNFCAFCNPVKKFCCRCCICKKCCKYIYECNKCFITEMCPMHYDLYFDNDIDYDKTCECGEIMEYVDESTYKCNECGYLEIDKNKCLVDSCEGIIVKQTDIDKYYKN